MQKNPRASLLGPSIGVGRWLLAVPLLIEVGCQHQRLVRERIDRSMVVIDRIGVGLRRAGFDVGELCNFKTTHLLGLEGALGEHDHVAIPDHTEGEFVFLDPNRLGVGIAIRASFLGGPRPIEFRVFGESHQRTGSNEGGDREGPEECRHFTD